MTLDRLGYHQHSLSVENIGDLIRTVLGDDDHHRGACGIGKILRELNAVFIRKRRVDTDQIVNVVLLAGAVGGKNTLISS